MESHLLHLAKFLPPLDVAAQACPLARAVELLDLGVDRGLGKGGAQMEGAKGPRPSGRGPDN